MMAVEIRLGTDLQPGRPVPLIDPWDLLCAPVRCYDVSPDGGFVTVASPEHDSGSSRPRFGAANVHLIWNFFEELKAKVGN